MSLRHRNPPSATTSSSSSPPSIPKSTSSGTEPPRQLEWYRYALNLFLARTLRFLGKFGFWLHNNRYHPRGIPASRQVRVGVRDGYQVLLNIYEPTSTSSSFPSSTPTSTTSINATNGRPCVINFHGGGFTIGSSTDDSRFAHWCTRSSASEASTGTTNRTTTTTTTDSRTTPNPKDIGLGATFISIEYRLSPEYPYPTPVYDCIDATKYILSHPREFGIDSTKVFLSGFSAGGSLAVTTALALSSSSSPSRLDTSFESIKTISDTAIKTNTESRTSTNAYTNTNTDLGSTSSIKHPILGVIPFYPVLDFSAPRSQKLHNSPEAKPLPRWMTRMFDTSYLPPSPTLNRKDSMISPGLCPDEDLVGFPNIHLCLCGGDVLTHEGRVFGERLQGMGDRKRARRGERERAEKRDGRGNGGGEREKVHTNEVIIREVPEVRHGWDKPPLPLQASVGVEYDAAIESMKRWCNER